MELRSSSTAELEKRIFYVGGVDYIYIYICTMTSMNLAARTRWEESPLFLEKFHHFLNEKPEVRPCSLLWVHLGSA